jgi:hypothetical protein
MTAIPPIRREILVDAGPAIAFEVFTARIGRWWPLAELSVHGADATVAFDDGKIIERSAGGDATAWARSRGGIRPPRSRSPGIPAGRRSRPATSRSPSPRRASRRW